MPNDTQIYYWAHMLDECFIKHLVTEGKHWPEDYVKTAFNLIKQSKLGQASWYNDEYIKTDLDNIISDFAPLSHKNSNLGFFMAIIRWFIEYSGDSLQKYQEFLERKLDDIVKTLLKIANDKSYDSQRESIKKMTFALFEKLAEEVDAKTSSKDILTTKANAKYNVIPIYSYEELHKKYGGNATGYKGESEWCHTNGKSTYNSWTKDGTLMFFVIEQDGWQNIKAPSLKPNDCYDAYGMSLIAILVDVTTNKLLNSTSRWNHVVLPKSGAADTMFENWTLLNKAIGINVEKTCKDECAELKKKINARLKRINEKVAKILANVNTINDSTIPLDLKPFVTKVDIPSNVTSIGDYAFYCCSGLTNVTIPSSVTSIKSDAFYNCTKLMSVTIGNGVTSIGRYAFCGCSSLTNVMIPGSVTSIGYMAFDDCVDLTNVTIGNGVRIIDDGAFSDCENLVNITIPQSVKNIGAGAFEYCYSLRNITIPDSVKTINEYAFFKCSSLTHITIPDSVEIIDFWAFSGCISLKHVAIPSSVTEINGVVFKDCNSLENVVFEGKTLEQVQAMEYYPWGIKDISVIQVA